jgi:NADPH-dependent 2,4-dienoyl-CoA reductase/sulfur reductase-like enzyme
VELDHLVLGIGVDPDIEWLAESGLAGPDGVRVDRDGRTQIPWVMAIGDAAATFDPRIGSHVAGSHWEAASRQAARAARTMLGLDAGRETMSSFWTDQYGIRIQYLGHARLADHVEIDGSLDQRSFTATYVRDGRPVAGLIVNRPRALPALRTLIEKGTT